MSRIDDLIAELCPEGVEFRSLEKVCLSIRAGGDLPSSFAKGQLEPTPEFPYPIYSNGSAANALYGYADSYRIDAEVVTVSARGTIGSHAVRRGKFTPIVRLITLEPNPQIVNVDFLDYALDITEIAHSGGSIPQLTVPAIKRIRIPVPPIEVQCEIVRILDTFSALKAELEAELEARRIQYARYRDEFISSVIPNHADMIPLSDLAGDGFFSDGDWVESKDQDSSGDVRLTQLADVGVGAFRDRSNRWMREDQASRLGCTLLEPGDVLIARMPDPLGRACQVPENIGRAVTVVDVAILRSVRADILPRYVMHAINSYPVSRDILSFQTGGTRQRISRTNLGTVRIPVPSMAEQERIVGILDNFDALVNDLSVGLPAELAARRTQYEHYRDRLLTFEERV